MLGDFEEQSTREHLQAIVVSADIGLTPPGAAVSVEMGDVRFREVEVRARNRTR